MSLPNVASLTSYGTPKQNDSQIEDPTTDEDAGDRNNFVADVAAMTQTVDRAWARFVGVASGTPPAAASNVHGAVWGNDSSLQPVFARASTGVYTVAWLAQVTDANAVVNPVNLRHAIAFVEGSVPYVTTASVTAPNVVTAQFFTIVAGALVLTDPVGVTVGVRTS